MPVLTCQWCQASCSVTMGIVNDFSFYSPIGPQQDPGNWTIIVYTVKSFSPLFPRIVPVQAQHCFCCWQYLFCCWPIYDTHPIPTIKLNRDMATQALLICEFMVAVDFGIQCQCGLVHLASKEVCGDSAYAYNTISCGY